MAEGSAQRRVVLSFGRFELSPGERLLTADGAPVELGARTLDTLIALASRPNQALGKRELMAEVWPDVIVEEGSLRFHIAALRKALGDGKNGVRYIATLAGRGYCFVAPVARSIDHAGGNGATEVADPRATFLPTRLARMVGREESVGEIAAELTASRFVSIVGPGGVGKTTLAVAVARDLLPAFDGEVLFVDFGMLSDAGMAPFAVASMLGISIQSDDPTQSLIVHLRDKRMLLVLDNCEHVVEAVARLTERVFLAAPGLHILATSREALRVEGERVHRLAPLAVPPDDPALSTAATLAFPAARLFVERASASGARLDLADANAAIVASICRKLDGMALAIELAAGRVAAFGLSQIAALLDQSFALLWPGQRTAPARQRTLRATLDWSYGLLSETERVVFRRLAVFVGPFSLEAALAVVRGETFDTTSIFAAIDSLVAKSMVATVAAGATTRYRLLDAARAYAQEITVDPAERAALCARHAAYCLGWLRPIAADARFISDATLRASYLANLNNVRAALEWCFGDKGNADVGVSLAVEATPVFFALSLLTESQHWSKRAIFALDDASRGGRNEMRLQAALALSLMWTRGNTDATFAALTRSIAIAEELGDTPNQITLLAPLHVFHMRIGEFSAAQRYAEHVVALTRNIDDPAAAALSRILSGYSLHFAGDLSGARRELEAARAPHPDMAEPIAPLPAPAVTMKDDALAAPILALASSAAPSALSRTLWLQGCPVTALEHSDRAVRDAASTGHPATLSTALTYAVSVLLWNGDLDDAEREIARFIANAESYALTSHVVLGRCFQGQLTISRGDAESGIEELQAPLAELHALRYELLGTAFNMSLVQAFAATGRVAEGMTLIDETIRCVEANGDFCYMPELQRLKAGLLARLPRPLEDEADIYLSRSLALSRRQGALAWELRTAIDMARRSAIHGSPQKARARMQQVCEQFEQGSDTADLRIARGLLAELS